MQSLIQRVSEASVSVEGREIARIGRGILVLLAVMKGDEEKNVVRMAERLLSYRIFARQEDLSSQPSETAKGTGDEPRASARMNSSVTDIGGQMLLVPQFTLGADVRKGTRPSFHPLAEPQHARKLFDNLCAELEKRITVARGIFGADMRVSLINEGPVTFLLQS